MTVVSWYLPAGAAGTRHRALLTGAALLGLAWNVFGVVQFVQSLRATMVSLMAMGLTASQAERYLDLPAWTTVMFGIGVCLGVVGCVALFTRHRFAAPLLLVSLLAYVLLFIGDLAHGLFAAIPAQLGVLLLVLVIACALWLTARHARRAGWLR